MRQQVMAAGLIIVTLIVVGALLAVQTLTPARATDETLSTLISDLWNRVLEARTGETSSAFTFTIEFEQGVAGVGSSVTLGQGLNNQQIAQIGADYFCLSRVFSRSLVNDCIPFSNIIKINFREEQ